MSIMAAPIYHRARRRQCAPCGGRRLAALRAQLSFHHPVDVLQACEGLADDLLEPIGEPRHEVGHAVAAHGGGDEFQRLVALCEEERGQPDERTQEHDDQREHENPGRQPGSAAQARRHPGVQGHHDSRREQPR